MLRLRLNRRINNDAILTGAAGDLSHQTTFTNVTDADAVRKLRKMLEDLLDAIAATQIVADDRVKHVAAVDAIRHAVTHDLLDLTNGIAAAVAVVAVTNVCDGCRFCFATLAQTIAQSITRSMLVEALNAVEPVTGDRQHLPGVAKKLSGDVLAVIGECEFPVDLSAGGQAPDPYASAARRHLAIAARGQPQGNSAPIDQSNA